MSRAAAEKATVAVELSVGPAKAPRDLHVQLLPPLVGGRHARRRRHVPRRVVAVRTYTTCLVSTTKLVVVCKLYVVSVAGRAPGHTYSMHAVYVYRPVHR